MGITVRPALPSDRAHWLRMRQALWPDGGAVDHGVDIDRFFAGQRRLPLEVLLAIDARTNPVGFVELSIRNIVDSCDSDRVGYLEGWYVDPAHRRRGVGRALVRAAEQWALEHGCVEFASDVLIENTPALHTHRVLGFEETGRVCNFRKSLR